MEQTKTFIYTGEYITLGQFLKAADLAQSGGEAKELLTQGAVMVNNEVETRRGRKLRDGDLVRLGRTHWLLAAAEKSL